uniref:CEP41 n=1 Tax=Schmidtea mediterranea TaxID=79327 RepID=H6WA32_SCHMD|nr:CEP41 [Schmidtea mediterranea]
MCCNDNYCSYSWFINPFNSVISGVGELDINNTNVQSSDVATCENDSGDPIVYDTMPYLLLDVRDRDQYDQCHIIKSLSYPSAMISRSVNFETKEMLACRNKPGKIIVIYDEEERIAPRVADTLVQRGYENLFMLSGGLRVAYKKFPKGLITGKISESIRHAVTPGGQSKTKQKSVKAGDLPVTSQSQRSVQSSAISSSESSEIKSDFTMDDLANLSMNLDAALDSKSSVGSSIYSQNSKSITRSLSSAEQCGQ